MPKTHTQAPQNAARDDVRLVLVDFDDTLVETGPRFRRARERLFALIERAGLPYELAERVHHDEVDPEMIERHGLGPFRLEPSFRETYRRVCSRADREPDPALADACAKLAGDVIGTPPVIEGALDALHELTRAHPTVVYTQAADADYQLGCVRGAGVLRVVEPERVHICERKTADAFRATLRRYGVDDPTAAYMIGNSIRSDVNPALAAGARAILVETDVVWQFDHVEPVADDFLRVRSFAEAVQHLLGDRTGRDARSGDGASAKKTGRSGGETPTSQNGRPTEGDS